MKICFSFSYLCKKARQKEIQTFPLFSNKTASNNKTHLAQRRGHHQQAGPLLAERRHQRDRLRAASGMPGRVQALKPHTHTHNRYAYKRARPGLTDCRAAHLEQSMWKVHAHPWLLFASHLACGAGQMPDFANSCLRIQGYKALNLHGLAEAHLVADERAAAAPQRKAHAGALKGHQAPLQPRWQALIARALVRQLLRSLWTI